MNTLYAGLVTWILTLIIVESEIARPLRSVAPTRCKINYLVACTLCTGTWVGLAVAAVAPARPLGGGITGWLLAALVIKGVAHAVFVLQKGAETLGALSVHVVSTTYPPARFGSDGLNETPSEPSVRTDRGTSRSDSV